jgi:manganese/zinc/iron transport system permease protein
MITAAATAWQRIVVQPWTEDFFVSFWIVAMGFFVTAACGVVGTYLLLRRMTLIGDAISHSILFGLVVAFLVVRSGGTAVMFCAALATGLLTVGIVEFIHRQSRIKPDAALCITFTTLFAAGVALLSLAERVGAVHLDAECVLYGEIAFVPLDPPVEIAGLSLGPAPLVRIAAVLLGLLVLAAAFYKELLVTSFDPALARSLGMRSGVWHYGLMAVLSIVIVSVFEAVGAILTVAMLVVPPMFAAQLSDRLPVRFALVFLHAALSSLLGYQMSVWLNCSPAGAMVVAGALLFLASWAVTRPRYAARTGQPEQTGEAAAR